MIYKLGLLGASGKVGSEVAFLARTGFKLNNDFLMLADAVTDEKKITSIEGVSARTFDTPPNEKAHVWIDFSRPEGTMKLLDEAACPVVIGTTGFSQTQLEKISAFSKNHAVLLSPNMSPGMNILMSLLERFPLRKLAGFSTTLSEEHHRFKKDSPSGTAKKLLDILDQRGYGETQVHVTRAGSIVGNHKVQFISDHEKIVISHSALDRKVFAEGALLAAFFLLKNKKTGLYRMNEVFADESFFTAL